MVCFLKEVSECVRCLELRSGMGNGGQMKKKTWKFSRATLGFCEAEQVEASDGSCLIKPGQPGLVNQRGLIKQKQDHGPLGQVINVSLSEPTALTTVVPF